MALDGPLAVDAGSQELLATSLSTAMVKSDDQGNTRLVKRSNKQHQQTDTLIAALVSRAQGKSLAVPSATAALEACAGTVGRGFAASEVTGPDSLARALTPGVLELVGRSLIQRGEVVFLIDTTAGKLRLIPAETHDVEGGPFPEEWEYRLTLGGPSRTVTYDFKGKAHRKQISKGGKKWIRIW